MSVTGSHTWRSVLLLLGALGSLQLACAHAYVSGYIPPSTFQFTSVVPYSGSKQGGWKVAQVLVLLGKISTMFPEAAYCDIEVGVPEVNWKGPVSDELAQGASALAADEAARLVFQEGLPTAMLCTQFRGRMEFIMGNPESGTVPGTRVTKFLTPGIPRKTFP
jgi:hypothetical protein